MQYDAPQIFSTSLCVSITFILLLLLLLCWMQWWCWMHLHRKHEPTAGETTGRLKEKEQCVCVCEKKSERGDGEVRLQVYTLKEVLSHTGKPNFLPFTLFTPQLCHLLHCACTRVQCRSVTTLARLEMKTVKIARLVKITKRDTGTLNKSLTCKHMPETYIKGLARLHIPGL